MKLKYSTPPESEGGAAVPGCGTIHISEIEATLTNLSDDLEFPFDLNDYVTGSTGKSEYSGDIDVVLDDRWWGHGPVALREYLAELYGVENTARNGSMIHLKYPIAGYDPKKNSRGPRTGFVQVDFSFGNYTWEKFYHHSPGDESEYKGAHRNLILAAICAAVNVTKSDAVDSSNRPIEQVRYKFGEYGLYRVRRTSQKDKRSGQWLKKQHDEVLNGPFVDPEVISRILLPVDGVPEDLFSLETIMAAIKRNYGMTDCERIWKRTADNFYDWKDGRNFLYPEEISKYFPQNDK
jgi:hypothetical protein